MAQQEKNQEEVREEIDAEDELDGWGPVRVRRSTIPSAPPDGLRAAGSDPASGTEPTQNKTLMT
ncbi:MAG TPA: hypothetical protein VFN67_34990 [Polyangiales bacterium]|nr:hypothetical protein [Polyangiales bacterium]